MTQGAVPSSKRWAVPDPEAGSRAEPGSAIPGIGEPAALERQTAAPDALGEAGPEALQLGDSLIDPRPPFARETRPVAAVRRSPRWKLRELRADLLERQPDPLGEHDERDPPQYGPRVATMARAGTLRCDQAALLV